MEILVSISTRHGVLVSPLFPRGQKNASLIIHGPCSVQDLRDTSCKNYVEPVVKWLDSIRLEGTGILPERFDELMHEFAICFSNANTHGIIYEQGVACVEFTMVFSNLPVYTRWKIYDYETLQELTKDLTLSEAWSE